MKRNIAIAGGIAAGVTAIALIAGPAIAQGGSGNGNGRAGDGYGVGMMQDTDRGMMDNSNVQGNGMRMGGGGMGSGLNLDSLASGTLTIDQKANLASMAEEEKLAHDLYVALAAKFPDVQQFSRISRAETHHLDAVRALLTRYDIADPTAGLAEGEFASSRFQSLYDSLLAGATTQEKALAAGVTVEQTDIADLTADLKGITAPDVVSVFTHLRTGSEHHLAAFGG